MTKVAKADCPIIGDETGFTLECFLSQIDGFYFVRETREARRVYLTALTASANRYGDLRAAILRECRTRHL